MAILLQTPQVTGVTGSTLRVAHPDLSKYTRTFLASNILAGATAMSVYDNENFADNDFFLAGWPGESRSEECDVNGAVTRGTSLVVTNSLKFNHNFNDPITRIFERQIRAFGNSVASESGATEIATTNIDWSRPFTEITITGTTYDYYYFKFYDGTTLSPASDFIAASGLSGASAQALIDEALNMSGAKMGAEGLSKAYLVASVNEAQNRIIDYKDPDTNQIRNWPFEETEDSGLSVVTYEHRYALSGLTDSPKFTNGNDSIMSIWVGRQYELQPLAPKEFKGKQLGSIFSSTTGASIGATSLVLANASEFGDDGSVYVRGQVLTYTGKSGNTLTGIPASGTGSITATIQSGDSVWQNNLGGNPKWYTVFGGYIHFDCPFGPEYSGYPLVVTHNKRLPSITELTDATEVDFYHIIPYYVSYKIELQRKNKSMADSSLGTFLGFLETNAGGEKSNMLDVQTYYEPENGDLYRGGDNWPNSEAGRDNPV